MRNRLTATGGITVLCVLVAAVDAAAQGGTWDQKEPLPTARLGVQAEAVNGMVYAIGGSVGGCPGPAAQATQAYNPVTDLWSSRATLGQPPGAVGQRTAFSTAVVDGLIYAFGGGNCLEFFGDVQVYDPVADSWTVRDPMPSVRSNGAAVSLDGKIYLIGGYSNPSSSATSMSPTWEYDPVSQAFTPLPAIPTARIDPGLAVLDGKIYVVGGMSSAGAFLTSVDVYDPGSGWSTIGALSTARRGPVVAVVGGLLYAFGGSNGAGILDSGEVYDPGNDTWVPAPSLPAIRTAAGKAVLDDVLYVVGGLGTGISATNFVFTPPPPDADADGVSDAADNCPADANADQADADGDGIGDACDTDDDSDGVEDGDDNCAVTANSDQADNDGDGIGDACDPDDDNDGVVDGADNCPLLPNADQADTDGDGQGDGCDPDDDNDGVTDGADAFPLNAFEWVDSDLDGVGNNSDPDDDNDGVADGDDSFPLNAAESVDTDGDGTGNNADTDDDNDGTPDAGDPFPLDPLNVHPIFMVDSTLDLPDAAPGNGICATATSVCTLRAAVQEANALAGADTIHFAGTIITVSPRLDVTGTLTIVGNGAGQTIIQGCDAVANPACVGTDRIFNVQDGARLTLTALTVRNGAGGVWVGAGGGAGLVLTDAEVLNNTVAGIAAIGEVTIRRSRLAGNHVPGGYGGAIHAEPGTTLQIEDSTFEDNSAIVGGAIFTNSGTRVTSFTITGSTFSNNSTTYDGGAISVNGGGPYRITNTTFSGNVVEGTDPGIGGGAIFADAPVQLAGVTFSGNVSGTIGAAIHARANIAVRNTIVGGAGGANCAITGGGSITSFGYNLSSDATCALAGTGDLSGLNPGLAPLADNGGPTPTHALLGSSPAIDAGNPAGCTDTTGTVLVDDQRGDGFTRAIDGDADGTPRCDIGAVEGVGITADYDGDGVPDVDDAFPLDANESIDTDGDGTGNDADTDDDGDGVSDAEDAFALDANESVDTDGDGTGNNADTDDDGDGVPDDTDAFDLDASESVDTDNDGTGNNADTDDDNDGVPDDADAFDLDAGESVDTDGDGTGNNADTDDDNDGFFDIVDGCPLVPGPANGCSPTEAVTNLETAVTDLNLAENTERVLTTTLANVDRAVDSGNEAAARALLGAFVRQVEALEQRGILSAEAAAALIAEATGIAMGL